MQYISRTSFVVLRDLLNVGIQLFLKKQQQQHNDIVLKKSSNVFISNACLEQFSEVLKSSDCVASTQIFRIEVWHFAF